MLDKIYHVALLAEGVDRNIGNKNIEFWKGKVALLAEGVDRNIHVWLRLGVVVCRPPRGGRG